MLKAEAKLQDAINDAYLWLWDRIGITVGMITFLLIAAEYPVTKLLFQFHLDIGIIIAIGMWGILAVFRHMAQMSGNFTYCNLVAKCWRYWYVRWIFIYPPQLLLLLDHYTTWIGWADTILVIAWVNVWGCYVRERKPQEKLQLSLSTFIL